MKNNFYRQMSLPYDPVEFEDQLRDLRVRLQVLDSPNREQYLHVLDLLDENHRINMALVGAVGTIDDIFSMLERQKE